MVTAKKGFTLMEIMMVIAIIAMLASIAIPHLIRSRMTANDSLAQSTLRVLSTAAEKYALTHRGEYPQDETSLTTAVPPYLNRSYCQKEVAGFYYNCWFPPTGYFYEALPITIGVTGSTSYTMTTGGVLLPELGQTP